MSSREVEIRGVDRGFSISSELSTPSPRPPIEELLRFADELQVGIDRLVSRRSLLKTVLVSLVSTLFAAGLLFGWRYVASRSSAAGEPEVLALPLVVLVGAIAFWQVLRALIDNLERRLRRDERALGEAVALLRDLVPQLDENHGFTALDRAMIRIRLSRYDIPDTIDWLTLSPDAPLPSPEERPAPSAGSKSNA